MKNMIQGQKAQRKADSDARACGKEGLKLVGFGKYSNLMYDQFVECHSDYCRFIHEKTDVHPQSRMASL